MSISEVPIATADNSKLTQATAMDMAKTIIPSGGFQTEDDMLVAQVANMQGLVEHARRRWWLAGLIIDAFLSGADPSAIKRTTRHKPQQSTIAHYCRLCAEYCNSHLGTNFTPGSFYVAYQAVQTAKAIPVDPSTQSVWHVYDVQRATESQDEQSTVLANLNDGTLSSRGLKDTSWLRANGFHKTPLAEPVFWVDPATSAIYLQLGPDSDLEPCIAPSRAWALLVRRIGGQVLSPP